MTTFQKSKQKPTNQPTHKQTQKQTKIILGFIARLTAAYNPWVYTTSWGLVDGLINGGAYIRGGLYPGGLTSERAYIRVGLKPE